MVKLDLKNAFNGVRRYHLMETYISRAPSVALIAHLAYSKPSIVLADGQQIESAAGIQQGDQLDPLLFALAVDDAARYVKSKFNVWYLDDATISDDVDTMVTDNMSITNFLYKIGLVANFSKSYVINDNYQ